MNDLKFEIPEGYEVDLSKSDFLKGYVALSKKELNLAKSWGELENIYGYFVGDTCNIEQEKGQPNSTNKNVFCTYPQAKASIALAQLSHLREAYRQGWTPDWDDVKSTKWCVVFYRNRIIVDIWYSTNQFLAFQSKEIAQEFLNNFGILILQAKPLIS
jgi:hypothetical protein